MRLKYHKINYSAQFIILVAVLLSFIVEFLKWIEGMSIIGFVLLNVFAIWQVFSAMYNSLSYENILFRKHLNIYWAVTIPTIIIFLLQYAELVRWNSYLAIGTVISGFAVGIFYLYAQYIFIYKKKDMGENVM